MKSFRTFKFCTAVLAGIFVFLSSAGAQQQDITKGSIAGIVRDPTGAIVTGAKVTLDTPQGVRTSSTNVQGEYAFGGLPPGPGYAVTAEKPGFSRGKLNDLSVSVNARTTADFALRVGQTATTVDVVAISAETIDLASTSVGATLDESLYKNIPVGRNISSIINMAPGVSESAGAGGANPSINGASGLENQYNIDGADVTDAGFGGFGTYSRQLGPLGNGVNFDFVEQVQVKSGGFEAQYGTALGGIINMQTKSGGNQYHGAIYGFFQPIAFEGTRPNPDKNLVSKGTYLENQGTADYGGNLGGYIRKDKLFFFIGFNPTKLTTAEIADPGFSNYALGTQYTHTTTYNYVAKLTWNLSDRHTIDASVYGDPAISPIGFQLPPGLNTVQPPLPADTSVESGLNYGSRTWTIRYNGTLSSHWLLAASYSDHNNTFSQTPLASGYKIQDNTAAEAGTGGTTDYGGIGFLESFVSKSHQVNIGSSHAFNWMGAHSLDFGFQYENQPYSDVPTYSGGDFTLPNLPELQTAAGKTVHGGFFVRQYENPKDPNSPIVLVLEGGNYSSQYVNVSSSYASGYVQDAWTPGRHITLKLGLREEQQSMSGNALRYVFAHNWAPRLGLIYDPTGSHKSKIFGNWGRFYEKIPQDLAIRAFSFETSVLGPTYKDPGVGQQPNLSPANYIPGQPLTFLGSPAQLETVVAGTGSQYQDEYVLGYEREFDNGFTFSGRYVRRDLERVLEDVSGIDATQALAGIEVPYVVANPGNSLNIFQNGTLCTPPAAGCVPDAFPNAVRIYKGLDLALSKRFSKGYQFYANYTLSSLIGNYQGNYISDNAQADPNNSTLYDFTNADGKLTGMYEVGPLNTDRRNQIKFYGNKSWKALNVGLAWSIESGTPITKLLDHPVYGDGGELPDGPRGAYGRTPWQLPISLHADYMVKLNEKVHVDLIADLFNVLNQTRVNSVQQWAQTPFSPGTPNPDFLKPEIISPSETAYESPFNARLGVRFEF